MKTFYTNLQTIILMALFACQDWQSKQENFNKIIP